MRLNVFKAYYNFSTVLNPPSVPIVDTSAFLKDSNSAKEACK